MFVKIPSNISPSFTKVISEVSASYIWQAFMGYLTKNTAFCGHKCHSLRDRGELKTFLFIEILILWLHRSPSTILEPYDKLFWGFTNGGCAMRLYSCARQLYFGAQGLYSGSGLLYSRIFVMEILATIGSLCWCKHIDIGSVGLFGYLWPQKMQEFGSLWPQK